MSIYTGSPQVGIGQPYLNNDSTPLNNPGQVIFGSDGSKYVYVQAGATAITSGMLLQSPAQDTGEQDVAVAATAVGATQIVTTTTLTVTANQYAGGYVVVSVTPGIGYRYKIQSHPAATAAALTITLAEPVQVALTTSSRIDLTFNPYVNVIPSPTTPSSSLVGVACGNITAGNYGWACVRGVATVINDAAGALVVGTTVMASTSVAGSVRASTGAVPEVGTVNTGVAASESGLAFITLG